MSLPTPFHFSRMEDRRFKLPATDSIATRSTKNEATSMRSSPQTTLGTHFLNPSTASNHTFALPASHQALPGTSSVDLALRSERFEISARYGTSSHTTPDTHSLKPVVLLPISSNQVQRYISPLPRRHSSAPLVFNRSMLPHN